MTNEPGIKINPVKQTNNNNNDEVDDDDNDEDDDNNNNNILKNEDFHLSRMLIHIV